MLLVCLNTGDYLITLREICWVSSLWTLSSTLIVVLVSIDYVIGDTCRLGKFCFSSNFCPFILTSVCNTLTTVMFAWWGFLVFSLLCLLMEILVWGIVTLPHLYLIIFYISVDSLVFVSLREFKSRATELNWTIIICFVAQDVPAVAFRDSFRLGPFLFWQLPFFYWIFFLFLTPDNVPGSSCLFLIPGLESSAFP